ncbi:hypothetical protein JJQ73_02000 [Corynebacterium glutamicum]|uniref:hypothetical protein n=1 Tax=Corynebacterium glutamicum TaxID=1718 RepID=UPI001C6EBB43|nr:hypothetical protein [Corynebacterium glutamicum]QYR17875.1 hypothetical protein JJQ73_02000 [Corynebacterium glutamicum]
MSEIFQPAQYVHIHTGAHNHGLLEQDSSGELNLYEVSLFSGVALGKFGFVGGDFSDNSNPSMRVRELADATGEWMAIAEQKNDLETRFIVFGDASGFCPIFYSEISGEGIIISDSFHGIIRGRAESGQLVSLNIGHYVTSVTAHHPHFDNPSVQQTMANEIQILRKDEALAVTADGVKIIPRSSLGLAGDLDNYEDALDQGIDSIRESLQMLSQQRDLIKTINFSGGVDSRMALSFVTSAGLENFFSLNSSDPRTWHNPHTRDTIERDIAIANKIRGDLGMSWSTKGATKLLQFDFQDSIAFHQGFRSNFSFNFRPIFSHSISEQARLTIRGGGGELLRATTTGSKIASQISELYAAEGKNAANASLIKKWYLRQSPAKDEAAEIVSNYFSELIGHFNGETVEESLNSYYQNTRNRTHFGHLRQSHTTNDTSIHLLANSYFLRAGELLPFEVKKSGKLVRDIFTNTDSKLLSYQFENEESTRELCLKGYKKVSFDYAGWQSEYDSVAKQKGKSEKVSHWNAENRGIISPYDKIASAESYLARAFRVVEELSGEDHAGIIRNVHQLVKSRATSNQAHLFSAAAKVASAVDLRFPVISHGNVVHLHCQSSYSTLTKELPVNISSRSVPRDGWNDKPIVEITPILSVVDKKFVAEVETNIPATPGMRFAFHLYRGKERVGESWYAYTQRRVFSEDPIPGKYTVRAYVKASGDLSPSYSFISEPIVVNKAES